MEKIAEVYGPKLGRQVNPIKEVLVTSGANGALSSFINALINPGDEMVVFEPCFPMYLDHCRMAGGTVRQVPLSVNDEGLFIFD